MPRRFEAAGLLALALLAFTAYASSLANGFVNWDDLFVVVHNRVVRHFDLRGLVSQVTVGIYHPVTLLTFAIEHRLFGLDPLPFHLTNLLLHSANTVLAARLALRLAPAPAAFAAAALFAVHPLHVESVAWVSERKDLLCALFYLGSLLAYLRFAEGRRPGAWLGCLALLALALLSKPMAVTAPLAMLALDHWLGRRDPARMLLEKLPFAALALLAGLRNLATQAPELAERFAIYQLDAGERLGVALRSLAFYTARLVWPHPLSAYYDIDLVRVAPGEVALAVAVLAALAALAWRGGGRGNAARFGLLFYLIGLAPVLKLVPFGGNSLFNDRYTYLPSLGFLLAATGPLAGLPGWARGRRIAAGAALLLVVGVLAVRSFERCRVWRDSGTLWSDVLARHPETSVALNHLGLHELDVRRDPDRALQLFERASRARPESPEPWLNRGRVHRERGELAAAIESYTRARELGPENVDARIGLATALLESGRPADAIAELEAALERQPAHPLIWHNLGVALLERGELGRARARLERAHELAPRQGATHAALGDVYRREGRRDAALGAYRAAALLGVDVAAEIRELETAESR